MFHNRYLKVIFEQLLYVLTCILLSAIFSRQVICSGFDLLLGNVGDARFNIVVQEHWKQVLDGSAQWLSPPYFFPQEGALGYSDALFLNAMPYSVLRLIGFDIFTSSQIVLFILVIFGWFGTVWFLRGCLKLNPFSAVIGAALFVFPNLAAVSTSHTQLLNVYLLPYLAVAVFFFLSDIKRSTFFGRASGVFLAVFVPAIFYTSYYVGWFAVFFILLMSVVLCILNLRSLGAWTVWKHIIWKRNNIKLFLPYCIIGAVCFIPFLITYVPASVEFGSRAYQEVNSMLPSLIDYLNVGPDNWLWGKLLYSISPAIGSKPMAHELNKGLTLFCFFAYGAALFFYTKKLRGYSLSIRNGKYQIDVAGREPDNSEKLIILAALLSITIALAWLLMLKIQGISLWWLIFKVIPGAGAIRAVYRFQYILCFPLAVVIAIASHQVLNYIRKNVQPHSKRCVYLSIWLFFCLAVIGEQFNTGSIANFSKRRQRELLSAIPPPPVQAKVFAVLPVNNVLFYDTQISAMLVAQKYKLYTINGYSGQFPIGWDRILYCNMPEYMVFLIRWIKGNDLLNRHLYFLNVETGDWFPSGKFIDSAVDYRFAVKKTAIAKDVFTLAGCRKNGCISSTGKQGFLIYGPYVFMYKGQYSFRLYGKGVKVEDAWGDIVSGRGKVRHCKFRLRCTGSNNDMLAEGTFKLDKYANDIELRVYVGENDDIVIRDYTLTKL